MSHEGWNGKGREKENWTCHSTCCSSTDFFFKTILSVSLTVPLTDTQDSAAAKAVCPERSLLALTDQHPQEELGGIARNSGCNTTMPKLRS